MIWPRPTSGVATSDTPNFSLNATSPNCSVATRVESTASGPSLGQEAVAQFSSHSCKPTVLTWCGMTDILTREERTMLGHHIKPSTKSATAYNRDSQLLLQAKVAKVLQMIVDDELDPDASRASRLSRLLRSDLQEDPDEVSQESDFEDTEVASIHSKLHLADRPGMPIGDPDEYTFVARKLTGTVHVLQDEETDRLACGMQRLPPFASSAMQWSNITSPRLAQQKNHASVCRIL